MGKTEAEIKKNTLLLALLITYGASSAITVAVAKKTPGAVLVWNTQLDPQVCELCEALEGVEFDPTGVIPTLPLHLGCRCYWVLVFEVEK